MDGSTWLGVASQPAPYVSLGDLSSGMHGYWKGFDFPALPWKGGGKGPKGKPEGKSPGKGKGKGKHKGKAKGFHSAETAHQALRQFLVGHPNFVFQPREGVLPEHTELWNQTGESNDRLYKNLRKHFKDAPEEFTLLLRDIVGTTHWPVDRLNMVEKQSAARRPGDASSQSSRVSRASWLSGVSVRR